MLGEAMSRGRGGHQFMQRFCLPGLLVTVLHHAGASGPGAVLRPQSTTVTCLLRHCSSGKLPAPHCYGLPHCALGKPKGETRAESTHRLWDGGGVNVVDPEQCQSSVVMCCLSLLCLITRRFFWRSGDV